MSFSLFKLKKQNSVSGFVPSSFLSSTTSVRSSYNLKQNNIIKPIFGVASPEEDAGESNEKVDRKPQTGHIVTIDFILKDEGNTLFDSGSDISFALNKGNYVKDLHELVSKLSVGESIFGEEIDAGYGPKREEMIANISKEQSLASGIDYDVIQIGTELLMANGLSCIVTEKNENEFTIDANPPLAGKTYGLESLTLKKIENGPEEYKYIYQPSSDIEEVDGNEKSVFEVATFALGCFWGGELAFMRQPGVVSTMVGYTQGEKEDPSYEEVCSGSTGHTEGIQIVYNPQEVSFDELVELAMERLGDSKFKLNQVGNDRGTQYRHGIYYHNDSQKEVAQSAIFTIPNCVTECKPATVFYPAEEYHQQYLLKGGQSAKKNDKETIRCYG